MTEHSWPVVFLPGGVLPVGLAYGPLLAELGTDVDAHPKELEVYATDTPPSGYTLATEVEGIARVADAAGLDRFHLVGYSAGGASSLAFAAAYPDRLLTLAVMEPAFAGWQEMSEVERSHMERFHALLDEDGPEMLAAFQALQLAPGVDPVPPPPGPPASWMATRPAGIRAILRAFFASDLDLGALRAFDRPVWFALGGRSHPDYYARMADRLAGVFPEYTVQLFRDRHHFDPPHRIEPAAVAESLRSMWSRAEKR